MPLRREVLSDDAWKARLIAQGLPPHVAAFALTVFTAARAGEFARVDGTLEQLIGRRPTTLRELLATSS
jgi:hypothetical protein